MKIFNVFDIKRFAVHDGEGIRTTIFLKGCPLRCKWCQNPEGLLTQRQLIFLASECIHCRLCEKASKHQEIIYTDHPIINNDFCHDFDHIISVCPSQALRYDMTTYELDDLFALIKEDEVFYRHGGGVTFSGGEPLMQADALYDLLKRCHEEGVHTAIETSFYAPWSKIESLLDELDQIYVDLKVYDDYQHRQLTNVSNALIIDNIKKLLTGPHRDKVTIRTPLIPTMTATDDNIQQISQFLSQCYPMVKYELLNYNPLAPAKYELTSFEYGLNEAHKMFTKAEMSHFYDIASRSGIQQLIK